MTKEAENKLMLSNVLATALIKSKDGVGQRFEKTYEQKRKSVLETKRSECVQELNQVLNSILDEMSQIKILSDEIDRIDGQLSESDEEEIS